MPVDDVVLSSDELLQSAQAVDRALRLIQREMRRPAESGLARAPVTVPQMRALSILTAPENLNGMALKDLTRAMALSQSTVSGIVDRLERMKMVKRQVDEHDRRLTRIEAAEEVKTYVQKVVNEQRLGALIQALGKASSEERAFILQALETLERLLAPPRNSKTNRS